MTTLNSLRPVRSVNVTVLAAVLAASIAMGCGHADPIEPDGGGAPATIDVTPRSVSIGVGESAQLLATVRDATGAVRDDRLPTWTTSAASVATVSQTGQVVGISPGSAIIAISAGAASTSAFVTVTNTSNVTLEVQNQLIYPIVVNAAGTLRTIGAESVGQIVVTRAPQMTVTWELVRPTLSGRALGDPMSGVFTLTDGPGSVRRLLVNNLVGSTYYFAPVVTNSTSVSLLMVVNYQLQSEVRCFCVAGAGQSRVAFGYYRLFSNSNVTAFRDGSSYSGGYAYFRDFGVSVPLGSGARDFTFTTAP
jgi:hypothetical protein